MKTDTLDRAHREIDRADAYLEDAEVPRAVASLDQAVASIYQLRGELLVDLDPDPAIAPDIDSPASDRYAPKHRAPRRAWRDLILDPDTAAAAEGIRKAMGND